MAKSAEIAFLSSVNDRHKRCLEVFGCLLQHFKKIAREAVGSGTGGDGSGGTCSRSNERTKNSPKEGDDFGSDNDSDDYSENDYV